MKTERDFKNLALDACDGWEPIPKGIANETVKAQRPHKLVPFLINFLARWSARSLRKTLPNFLENFPGAIVKSRVNKNE
jgi:hypothetical protein